MARFGSSAHPSNSSKPWRAVAPFAALGLIGLHQGCASKSGTEPTGSGTSSGSSAATGSMGASGTTAATGTTPTSGTTAATGTTPTSGTTAATGTGSGTTAAAGSSGTVATAGATSGSGSGTTAAAGSSGTTAPTSGTTAASGTAPTVCPGTATAVQNNALPYAVDNDFAATGYEGDYESITNTGDTEGTACGGLSPATPRASAKAACWKITYTVPGPDAAMPTTGYASVAWQANVQSMGGGTYYNNFGVAPGVIPPAGAMEASLWAKGAVGGEMVSFAVGSSGTAPCTDSVVATAVTETLTTTWQKYTIPFPAGVTYTAGQVNGFAWAVGGAPADTTVSFYIDNVQWDAN